MKLLFTRTQEVEIELLRQPTKEEKKILLGQDKETNMFELPEDLINFDKEYIKGEDYSQNCYVYIPEARII